MKAQRYLCEVGACYHTSCTEQRAAQPKPLHKTGQHSRNLSGQLSCGAYQKGLHPLSPFQSPQLCLDDDWQQVSQCLPRACKKVCFISHHSRAPKAGIEQLPYGKGSFTCGCHAEHFSSFQHQRYCLSLYRGGLKETTLLHICQQLLIELALLAHIREVLLGTDFHHMTCVRNSVMLT